MRGKARGLESENVEPAGGGEGEEEASGIERARGDGAGVRVGEVVGEARDGDEDGVVAAGAGEGEDVFGVGTDGAERACSRRERKDRSGRCGIGERGE